MFFDGIKEGVEVEVVVQYNDGYLENLLLFVNNVWMLDGGIYEVGFCSVWMKVFNEYVCKVGLLKDKDKNLEGFDVCEGLFVVILL